MQKIYGTGVIVNLNPPRYSVKEIIIEGPIKLKLDNGKIITVDLDSIDCRYDKKGKYANVFDYSFLKRNVTFRTTATCKLMGKKLICDTTGAPLQNGDVIEGESR